MSGVEKEVNSSEPGCQIAKNTGFTQISELNNSPSPPPSVVFSSEVEIAKKNGRLRARDDKDNGYQEQKSKHVVDLNQELCKLLVILQT